LGGDKSVPIRCLVCDLKAKDGNMTLSTMVLDTEKSALKGEGNINFRDETLDLTLHAAPKDISLVALRGPINVTGTFKNPKPAPELTSTGGRVALTAILGTLAGPLAFIPLLEFGGGENSNCAALLREAEESSKKQPVKP
jgi:AsmA family protein